MEAELQILLASKESIIGVAADMESTLAYY